jgi:hypothetical protein
MCERFTLFSISIASGIDSSLRAINFESLCASEEISAMAWIPDRIPLILSASSRAWSSAMIPIKGHRIRRANEESATEIQLWNSSQRILEEMLTPVIRVSMEAAGVLKDERMECRPGAIVNKEERAVARPHSEARNHSFIQTVKEHEGRKQDDCTGEREERMT